MKLINKILLKTLKHDKYVNVRSFLQEKLENRKLTTRQLLYLIKNMNGNTYMLQNVYPVTNALEKGILIEVIEECASLLDDALNLSSFSLEDGKGKLYNKVPYDLEHFLTLDCVKDYSDCKRLSLDSSYAHNKIQQVSSCLYQNNKLKTISYELFWKLIENDMDGLSYINRYNNNVSAYLKRNNQMEVFKIDELLKVGMNLFEISQFNYESLENLIGILQNTKEEIANDIESVDFKLATENYILQVALQEPVGLMIGIVADGEVQEINLFQQQPLKTYLFYNPTFEEDYIVEDDRHLKLLMAKFAQSLCQLEKEIHYTKEYVE